MKTSIFRILCWSFAFVSWSVCFIWGLVEGTSPAGLVVLYGGLAVLSAVNAVIQICRYRKAKIAEKEL